MRWKIKTLAYIDLRENKNKDKCEETFCQLPKEFDEEVARLRLEKIGMVPPGSRCSGAYPGVPVEGMYKLERHHYGSTGGSWQLETKRAPRGARLLLD